MHQSHHSRTELCPFGKPAQTHRKLTFVLNSVAAGGGAFSTEAVSVSYRDFYDIAMILKNHPLDREEILDLVRRKEIRKTISHASILQN